MKTFESFPLVLDAIKLVCADNNIRINPNILETKIPAEWLLDFEGAEVVAGQLKDTAVGMIMDENEIDELEGDRDEDSFTAAATGEATLADRLLDHLPNGQVFSRVLEAAFDGDLARLVHAK